MSSDPVDVIARTLLYEGYLLYPYRPSAVKNQQRFNFGVLYPRAYAERASGRSGRPAVNDAWQLQTECPVQGDAGTRIEVSVRFLQLVEREAQRDSAEAWHGAIERDVSVGGITIDDTGQTALRAAFGFPAVEDVDPEPRVASVAGRARSADILRGEVQVGVEEVRAGAYKLTVRVSNLSALDSAEASRNDALLRSLVSAHVVVRTDGGDLISLLDPPEALHDIAASCENVGVWPVLVGDEGRRDCMLASPIILYDYPQIAPESAGDLFDGTEIDEILALRILTLTDDEKREARGADERARQILDRTEGLPPEHWAKLHGAVRGLRRVTERTP